MMHRHLLAAVISAVAVLSACTTSTPATPGIREINVAGLDYAFQVPDSLSPGATSFRFANTGKVPHEMIITLLKPGVTLGQLMAEMQAGRDPQALTDGMVGILITAPGTESIGALHVNLLPGRTYLWVCTFQDSPDAKAHIELGMVASRTVALD